MDANQKKHFCDVHSNEWIPELALNDSFQSELHWFMRRCVIISLISTCKTLIQVTPQKWSFYPGFYNFQTLQSAGNKPGFIIKTDSFFTHLSKDRSQFMVTCSQRTFHQHGPDAWALEPGTSVVTIQTPSTFLAWNVFDWALRQSIMRPDWWKTRRFGHMSSLCSHHSCTAP